MVRVGRDIVGGPGLGDETARRVLHQVASVGAFALVLVAQGGLGGWGPAVEGSGDADGRDIRVEGCLYKISDG